MSKLSLKKIILIFILLLAAFLRLYKLDSVPPAPSIDEASTAYNAYSLLKISREEHGKQLPLILQSFDDWQPAMYAYLTIPFIYIFGLSVTAVRMPAVLLSILCVFITYLLVKELFKEKSNHLSKKSEQIVDWYALAASVLLAISPWHIYLSRLGYPANAGLSFFILSIYFLIRKRFIFAMVFFDLSAMSYHTEKVFLPIILISLLLIYWKNFWQYKIKTTIILSVGLILLAPFLIQTFAPDALSRFNATSVFNVQSEDMAKDLHVNIEDTKKMSILSKIVYNKKALGIQYAVTGYLSHFQPTWLFTNINAGQHKAPNIGLLYLWEIITIVLGIIAFLHADIDKNKKIFIFGWFLAAPVASAISTNSPHAVRSLVFLPTWQLFSGIGLVSSYIFLSKRISRMVVTFVFAVVLLSSVVIFFSQYFVVFPHTQSSSFQYALSQAMPVIIQNEDKYNKIVISNGGQQFYESYMYYLFYSKFNPEKYYSLGGTKSGGFAAEHKIGKYEFRDFDITDEIQEGNTLFVGSVDQLKNKKPIMPDFKDLDGTPELRMVEM